MITVLVQIEGVLADVRNESLVENAPIPEGLLLVKALHPQAQVMMYTDADTERALYWLQREQLPTPLKLFKLTEGVEDVEDMITRARFNGHDISLMVTANPLHVITAYKAGLQSMLFVHPSYGRPEWRPDYAQEPRPWDDMVEEVVAKRVTLAADGRTAERE